MEDAQICEVEAKLAPLIHRTEMMYANRNLKIRGYMQKFLAKPPGARTANGTAPCHYCVASQ
jgi:hypothetical protein